MMNNTGMTKGMGLPLFWLHTHFILGTVAVIGGILFTIWAVKTLKGKALLTIAIWITAIGVIGTLVTAPLGAPAWIAMMGGKHGKSGNESCPMHAEMMKSMMDMMSGHDADGEMRDMMQQMMKK